MNILLIGNGFDLAHGLPTRYTDFLEFVESFKSIVNNLKVMREGYLQNTAKPKYEFLEKFIFDEKSLCDEFKKLVESNIWIEYFLQNSMYQKENWIDFETEISKIIQSLDNDMHGLSGNYNIEDDIITLSNDFMSKKFSKYTFTVQQINMLDGEESSESVTFKEIRNNLLDDLNKLIRALEIYLCEYVEKIEIQWKSPDIKDLSIDYILSFNYTHVFSKLYEVSAISKKEVANPVDYIHGEANINNDIDSNNMVLGIDEYLPNDRRNVDIEFIAFKKYYQRIYKQTGSEYKRWIEIIENRMQEIDDKIKKQYPVQIPYNKIPNKCRNQLYIFGHSLDITDRDILRDLILNDNVKTTIFYPDKEELGRKIANLVKVIGQDELIRRTGGSTKTIEFKLQQPMEPIE